jgi:hypothetical protein
MRRDGPRAGAPAFEAMADNSALVSCAVERVQTGAKVGETIARLGGHTAPELRQPITVERIQRLSPQEGGEGMNENGQTNAAQALVRPRTRRRGGQPGNANAKKPVLALSTPRKRVRVLKRRVRAAMDGMPG